jgi:membrane-associated protease RseP (regulator of RpoE activity)
MRPGQANGQQGTVAGGQPGELGVWLVASGGPGVEIRRITDGSAAHQAGLRQGDVILQVNGRGATSPQEVSRMIRQIPAGEMVALQVWTNGTTHEKQVTLQPVREQYEVGFRGGEATSRASGDLASRTMRMEEQLAMVMRELQQLRQEMAQLRAAASSQPATGGGGFGEHSTEPGFDAIDESATQSTATPPGEAATPPAATEPAEAAAEPDPFADTATEPAEEPATAPAAEEPATEDADPFGASSDESTAEEATPAEGEPAEAETETDSDSIFE